LIQAKRNIIFSVAILCCISLLGTGLLQPIQTAQALSTLSDTSIDLQQISENTYVVSAGDVSITVEVIGEDNYRMSAVSEDGTTTSFELSVEQRPVSNANIERTSKNAELMEKIVLINGTKFEAPIINTESPQTFEYPTRATTPYITYKWDGIDFEEGFSASPYIDIKYPHPDRSSNGGISQFSDWYTDGNRLFHYQINSDTVAGFLSTGGSVAQVLIGAAIGAVIGGKIGGGYGAVGGAIGGAIAAGLVLWYSASHFVDEKGCIWWWINYDFLNTIYNWMPYLMCMSDDMAIMIAEAEFAAYGYLRVGKVTAKGIFNDINDPAPPQVYYALSAIKSSTGNGYVDYEGNIVGAPDKNYAYLNSGSYLNKAEITATLSNIPISGQLYLRCYTPTSSGANLKVYVCNTAGVWTQVKNTNLYPANSVMNVNCGYVTNIVKVSVVAYHEFYLNGVYYPSYIYADAVWVD